MTGYLQCRASRIVVGPSGEPLTVADLPPAGLKRWVYRRKAVVVAAVRGGLLTIQEACERYQLSVEEYLSWQAAIEREGAIGLRVDHTQTSRFVRTRGGGPGAHA